MAINDAYSVSAAMVVGTFGEVILINDQPADAVVDRGVKDLDEYGTVKATYTAISVLSELAAGWGESPIIIIDARALYISSEIDSARGLSRFRLAHT